MNEPKLGLFENRMSSSEELEDALRQAVINKIKVFRKACMEGHHLPSGKCERYHLSPDAPISEDDIECETGPRYPKPKGDWLGHQRDKYESNAIGLVTGGLVATMQLVIFPIEPWVPVVSCAVTAFLMIQWANWKHRRDLHDYNLATDIARREWMRKYAD